jgi:hypothetical protein
MGLDREVARHGDSGAGVVPVHGDPGLLQAFSWRRMIETGRHTTVAELAAAEKINSSYVSRVLRLTLLSPTMVEAILAGRQRDGGDGGVGGRAFC